MNALIVNDSSTRLYTYKVKNMSLEEYSQIDSNMAEWLDIDTRVICIFEDDRLVTIFDKGPESDKIYDRTIRIIIPDESEWKKE